MMKQASAQAMLKALGVDTRNPGFYDDPRFLAAERQDPVFLEVYAAFVREQRFDAAYLSRAERVVRVATTFLFGCLCEEKQHGKCIDGSMVLMRFLERQGVWSYGVKGALTLTFGKHTGLPTTYFAPIMHAGNRAIAGHVWLYAPPFLVADVATQLQPYRRNEAAHLPQFCLARELHQCRVDAHDLIEPEAVEQFVQLNRRLPTIRDAERMAPGVLESIRRLGAGEVCHGETRLRYVATGVTAPQEPLEEWKNLQVRGKYPIELYNEFAAVIEAEGVANA